MNEYEALRDQLLSEDFDSVKPQSRNEAALKNAIASVGMEGLQKPQSRMEAYLAALAEKMKGLSSSGDSGGASNILDLTPYIGTVTDPNAYVSVEISADEAEEIKRMVFSGEKTVVKIPLIEEGNTGEIHYTILVFFALEDALQLVVLSLAGSSPTLQNISIGLDNGVGFIDIYPC